MGLYYLGEPLRHSGCKETTFLSLLSPLATAFFSTPEQPAHPAEAAAAGQPESLNPHSLLPSNSRETEGRLSPSFQGVNSDPPHSHIGTAVDQEVGLAHSPLPTNAQFCQGLAERGSLGEGGWKRLGAPEFTRPGSLGFHNCMWLVSPFFALGGGVTG